MKNRLLLILACILSLPTQAQNSTEAEMGHVFNRFSTCNGTTFFDTIEKHKAVIQGIRLKPIGSGSYIAVENRSDAQGQQSNLIFQKPLALSKLTILGYHDGYLDMTKFDERLGAFTFWGFYITGTPSTVREQLAPWLHENERVAPTAPQGFARSEIRFTTTATGIWEKTDNANHGKVAKAGSTERVLMIDQVTADEVIKLGLKPPVTQVFCSLQGSLSAEVLSSERPELLK